MEPIVVQLEILIRFMPFSVIMLTYFAKFRAQTLPDHQVIIALYTIQTILVIYANILFCLKDCYTVRSTLHCMGSYVCRSVICSVL